MKRLLSSTALALALSVSAVAHAQTSGTQAQTPAQQSPSTQEQAAPSGAASGAASGPITQQQAGERMADNIIGTKVRNAQNESIGSISDLVIGDNGQVKAAVISVGGFLGIGDKKVAVPWDQLDLRTESASGSAGAAGAASDPVVMVNMTKEQLQQAPAFRTAAEQSRDAERTRTAPAGAPGTGRAPPAGGTSPSR